MATTPPRNLFGGSSSSLDAKKTKGTSGSGGSVGGIGRIAIGTAAAGSAGKSSNDTASWFDEDDESLLSQLVLGEEEIDVRDLDAKLDRLKARLDEDLSPRVAAGGDRWWTALLGAATSSGFAHGDDSSLSRGAATTAGSVANNAGGVKERELPKSFETPEGRAHLRALVDLLGIPRERAVRMTLTSLRSFASVAGAATATSNNSTAAPSDDGGKTVGIGAASTSPSASADSDKENDGGDDDDGGSSEQESKLRALLGTRELFRRVLLRHRRQFLARLRVVTESLRQEKEAEGRKGAGKSCAAFLDKFDSALTLSAKNRGLFKMLLQLAAGPPLPGMGQGELPFSVDELLRGGGGGTASNVLEGSEECLLAIRNESAEALLVLLYDRMDGGVHRFDLFAVLEAAKGCGEYEFGLDAKAYKLRGGSGGRGGNIMDLGESSPVAMVEIMKRRLDGLWALICAECMGLWRTNDGGNDIIGGWIGQHPLFSGLNLTNAIEDGNSREKRGAGLSLQTGVNKNDNEQTQQELEALCQKLSELGGTVRDRRQAAYNQSRKRARNGVDLDHVAAADAEDDDELWGIHAPEAVALLAFGLLLRLAHVSCPSDDFLTRLGETGGEFAQMANDDCGAFAYLHIIVEGMVLDASRSACGSISLRRGQMIGDEKLVQDLLRRSEVEMAVTDQTLSLMDEGAEDANSGDAEELVASDAASTVYASIGREILSATIRAFRTSLLSLQSPTRAVENIGMLADLASAIHCNSKILCEQFWNGWEEFCQGGSGESGGMTDDGKLLNNDEPMCYLLDASHSLAVSTMEELKNGGSKEPQAIIHYLKPLSTFLHLIASLCANSAMVQSVLTSEFLPEGLLANVMSVVAALAPLVTSLNASINDQQISGEERNTIRHASVAVRSISTLARMGGNSARDQIRTSLLCGDLAAGSARVICNIASQVVPARSKGNSPCCTALASSALNLLADLLVDADVSFQMETLTCFSSSSGSSNFGRDRMSGFAPYIISGDIHGEVTLVSMSILNCLAINLARNAFNASSISSGSVSACIETVGDGVMVALDVLSTLVSGGEVSFPTSKVQVATAHAILSSVVATLVDLKQVIYLHEDDGVRTVALAARNGIVSSLSSSTPLGRVVAFLASAPLSLSLTKKATSARELSQAMDAAAYYRESKMDGGGKYGAWGRFVTPKRASQKASKRRRLVAFSSESDGARDHAHSDLDGVVAMAQSLLLVWGEHAEDIANGYLSEEVLSETDRQNLLMKNSPCTLLLSKAAPSSLPNHAASAALNVANLDLISRFASAEDVLVGGSSKSKSAVLSCKIIKICLRHANAIAHHDPADTRHGFSAFRVALGGGGPAMFQVLLAAFDRLAHGGNALEGGYFERMEQLVLMTTIMLETVAVSVLSQPDLARSILLGGENSKDWRLVDKMVSFVMKTSDLIRTSRDNQNNVDNRVVSLCCLSSCACLQVVSELWKSCRLTCTKSYNVSSDGAHACGIIVSYLTNPNTAGTTSLIANVTVELTLCSLLSIMSLEEKNSLHDEVSTGAVHQKCVLLDIMTRSLDITAIETVSRVQTESQGGIKFVEDLFDSGPMECWKVLLSQGDAPAASAASSWLTCFSSSVGRNHATNWNIVSFLQANSADQEVCTSTWCASGLSMRLAKDLSSAGSTSAITSFARCNALHVLTQGEASLSASWATFFEVVASNMIATRPIKEVCTFSSALVETTLSALAAVSQSQMISESLFASQGFLESRDTKPIAELCSLLLFSLTVRRNHTVTVEALADCQSILAMVGRLYETANTLFVLTQLGSVAPSEAVCSIRQQLLSCALMLIADFESLPEGGKSRDDVVKYNELRIGFTDLAVNALQSLQYVQLEAHGDTTMVENAQRMPSKYGYGFGTVSDSSAEHHSSQEASFQLLRASLSLLSRLAPTKTMGSSSEVGDYHTYTYGVDFAACLKERKAVECVQYHLSTASAVASLTYQAVHAGSSSHVTLIHNNAVDIVCLVTTLFHTLIDAGSTTVVILLLLMENRCFRSLIDNPLLKTACKTWSSISGAAVDEVMSTTRQHRGYYTSLPRHVGTMSSTNKSKPLAQKDSVHFVWREVIQIFSSLLRSARFQSQTYARADESILHQLNSITSLVLDFVCAYSEELLHCFDSMLSEARDQSNLSSRGGKSKSTSFSSSIQSSSFAFTPNLLMESADISLLFAELCQKDIKNEFAHQCGRIYERVLSTSLELTKVMSSFLGSIGNARELFLALSSASSAIMLDQPTAMFDAHPLLAEGIPNARHEAIRNAHFAHSCCILATAEDFSNSHIATTKAAETSGKDKSLEQSFQIQVNNKFIAEVEKVAGHCLFNAMTVLSNTHPASDSFISFSKEEASRLDVAAVITPGTTVAICAQTSAHQSMHRYLIQSRVADVRYARTIGCDRSTRTISIEYADSGSVERNVPWSWIVGMEDTSKRHCIFSYLPAPKSMTESDTHGAPSLGHLILALKWCRHVGVASLDNANNCPMHMVKCVAERASILLCTEVLLHDEIRDGTMLDDTVRRVNMQLFDLFDYSKNTEREGLNPTTTVPVHKGHKNLALAIGEDILGIIQMNMKHQLQAACLERAEEQKMWEQNNSGWDNTTWASSSKRQGRRSPFRLMRKTSSGDSS